MFLKSELFSHNDSEVTLYELSALQRIEHLEYLAELERIDSDDMSATIGATIRASALLVAMSLWHGLENKAQCLSEVQAQVTSLQEEVMNHWPLTAIAEADLRVKTLSGMIAPVETSETIVEMAPGEVSETGEPVSAEKY
ncbi:phage tail assembly chaperone G [Entomohabitans teleogrylli]|uniref:phage tail assembly chaperone G n=1 Tax=Entomohabitans teleogrylli TaxID=1384589 RepID=UPI00073D989C|nr:phage minor tail protein G [Entomohabitans teleogrylli]